MGLKVLGKDGFYGWVNLAVMFFFNMAVMLMLMSFAVFLPFWVKEFGWSYGSISGAQQLSLVVTGLLAPIVGVFIMKHGARKSIIGGNLLCVAGLVMLSYQAHLWQLYLAYGIMMGLGMGMGGMLPMMTIINNWFVMKRSVALSVSMASMGLAGTVILPSLAKLINIIGWRNSYRMTAAVVFVLCVVIPALLIRNKPEELGQVTDGHAGEKLDGLKPKSSLYRNLYRTPVEFTAREALRTRALWLLTTYGMLQFLLLGGLTTHQIAYLSDIGISLEKAAVAGGVMSAVMAISQLGVGFLGLRFRMQSLAIISAAVGIMGFAILLYARSMPLVLAYNVIIGMGFGIQSIAMGNLIPDYFGRSEFPKIMGYTMPFVTILSSFGASIAGFVRDATGSFIPAFQIFLALIVVAFLCILFAKPPKHRSLQPQISQVESVKSV